MRQVAVVLPAAQVGHGVLEGGVLADAEGVDEALPGRCRRREPVVGRSDISHSGKNCGKNKGNETTLAIIEMGCVEI